MRHVESFDQIVGKNIRRFRLARGMSQQALAAQIGVTFQQLQKYESAANRVSAGRLFAIALALAIPVQALGEPTRNRARVEQLTTMLGQPGTLRFLESYASIPDPTVRALFLKWLARSPSVFAGDKEVPGCRRRIDHVAADE
jgi:transcriptional regulator with XRE-family HTH domain